MGNDGDMNVAVRKNAVLGEMQKNWGWLLALGILFLVLGVIGLGMTFTLTMVSVLFFGILILIGGVVQIIQSFKCRGWKSIIYHILIAVLYLLAGIFMVTNPAAASAVLTLLLAFALIAVGLVRIMVAFQHRGMKNWIWPFIGGILTVLLGLMIAVRWPVSGLFVIGLLVAIEMIIHGWSYIFIALAAKASSGSTKAAGSPAEAPQT
jgi:uncharacterized membrane protein HdeD (DUF308 family)